MIYFLEFMGTVHIPSRVPQFANAQPHILKKQLQIDAKLCFTFRKFSSTKALIFHDFFKIWWPPSALLHARCAIISNPLANLEK